jgi:hypothetical protein
MQYCSSSSGPVFSYNDYDNWNTNSNVSAQIVTIGVADLAHIAKNKFEQQFFSK